MQMQYKFSGPEFSQGTDLFPEFHTWTNDCMR